MRPAVRQARNNVFNVRWFGFAISVKGPHSWGACDEPARLIASIKENAASTSVAPRAFTAAVQASTPGAHFPPLLPAVRNNRRAVRPVWSIVVSRLGPNGPKIENETTHLLSGDDAHRWRDGAAAPRDAAIAPSRRPHKQHRRRVAPPVDIFISFALGERCEACF